MAGIYKRVLAGFEKHVSIEERHVAAGAVGPSPWLGTTYEGARL